MTSEDMTSRQVHFTFTNSDFTEFCTIFTHCIDEAEAYGRKVFGGEVVRGYSTTHFNLFGWGASRLHIEWMIEDGLKEVSL